MQCWDDERIDPERTINRIIHGVFHHPAQRNMGDDGAVDGRRLMFGVVEAWWRSQDPQEQQELRRQLSRDGVMNSDNHKEGVHDTGHGCGKPLGMAKSSGGASSTAAGALMGGLSSALGSSSGGGGLGGFGPGFGGGDTSGIGKFAEEAVGGGALGGLVGVLAGGVGGSLLSGAFGESKKPQTNTYASQGYTPQGGYQQNYTEVAHGGNQYAQAQYSETQLPGGGRETDYQRFQQTAGGYGAGFEQRTETRPTYGGGFEQTNERIYERPSGQIETETWREGQTADGHHYHEAEHHMERRDSDSDSTGRRKHGKHHKKHHSDSGDERDPPMQYQAPGGFGGGFGEPRRETFEQRRFKEPRVEEFGGRVGGYGQPPREEYEGRGGFGGGYREPPRDTFDQRRFEEPPRQTPFVAATEPWASNEAEFNHGAYNEPPRQEYGGRGRYDGYQEPSRGGYEEPANLDYGHGNEAGWGEREREREEEEEEEYREEVAEEREEEREEEYREERREEGGGWFS
jgi:hypothetical protein